MISALFKSGFRGLAGLHRWIDDATGATFRPDACALPEWAERPAKTKRPPSEPPKLRNIEGREFLERKDGSWERYHGDGERSPDLSEWEKAKLKEEGLSLEKAKMLKPWWCRGYSTAKASAEFVDEYGDPLRGFSESTLDRYWPVFYHGLSPDQVESDAPTPEGIVVEW